ncbi:hypothetical protein VNO77_03743 [Canavalia gladiata]|uniref:Uncharacterized protein n=1 Tax=Canavalia gladiata TaxID=3824 RepID=A0AAN9R8F2_CANGL
MHRVRGKQRLHYDSYDSLNIKRQGADDSFTLMGIYLKLNYQTILPLPSSLKPKSGFLELVAGQRQPAAPSLKHSPTETYPTWFKDLGHKICLGVSYSYAESYDGQLVQLLKTIITRYRLALFLVHDLDSNTYPALVCSKSYAIGAMDQGSLLTLRPELFYDSPYS